MLRRVRREEAKKGEKNLSTLIEISYYREFLVCSKKEKERKKKIQLIIRKIENVYIP